MKKEKRLEVKKRVSRKSRKVTVNRAWSQVERMMALVQWKEAYENSSQKNRPKGLSRVFKKIDYLVGEFDKVIEEETYELPTLSYVETVEWNKLVNRLSEIYRKIRKRKSEFVSGEFNSFFQELEETMKKLKLTVYLKPLEISRTEIRSLGGPKKAARSQINRIGLFESPTTSTRNRSREYWVRSFFPGFGLNWPNAIYSLLKHSQFQDTFAKQVGELLYVYIESRQAS